MGLDVTGYQACQSSHPTIDDRDEACGNRPATRSCPEPDDAIGEAEIRRYLHPFGMMPSRQFRDGVDVFVKVVNSEIHVQSCCLTPVE